MTDDTKQPADRIVVTLRGWIAIAAIIAFGGVILSGISFRQPGLPGHWFGESGGAENARQTIWHFTEDGRFRAEHRDLRDCRVVARRGIAGLWEMTPQSVKLRLTEVDGAPRDGEERFELGWLSENRLSLRSEDGGISALRVPADFDPPPPQGCPDAPMPTRG